MPCSVIRNGFSLHDCYTLSNIAFWSMFELLVIIVIVAEMTRKDPEPDNIVILPQA